MPSPYAEETWLHVPPLKRRDEGRPAKAKEIKQQEDERRGKAKDPP